MPATLINRREVILLRRCEVARRSSCVPRPDNPVRETFTIMYPRTGPPYREPAFIELWAAPSEQSARQLTRDVRRDCTRES